MSRIDQQPGTPPEQLETARQPRTPEPLSGCGDQTRVGFSRLERVEPAYAGDGQCCVGGLMRADHAEPRVELEASFLPVAQPRAGLALGHRLAHGSRLDPDLVSQTQQRRTELLRASRHHGQRLGGQGAADAGHARLDDARFLAGDGRQRRSQLVGVLEFDARDAGDGGRHHVGRVEAPSEPHLENHAIHPGARKEQQTCRRGDVEEGRTGVRSVMPHRIDVWPQAVDGGHELGPDHRLAVDPEALGPALQMGRGEGSHALAGRREDRLGEQAGGSLALGARDVDDRHPALGVSDGREQPLDRSEVEARILEARPALEVDQSFEIGGRRPKAFEACSGRRHRDYCSRYFWLARYFFTASLVDSIAGKKYFTA